MADEPSSPPLARGGYTINWDEIDEFSDPFASKPALGGSKMASSPPKGGSKLASSPPKGGSKLASSPPKGGSKLASSPPKGGSKLASSPPKGGSKLASSPPKGGSKLASSPPKGGSTLASSPPIGGSKLASSPPKGGSKLVGSPPLERSNLTNSPACTDGFKISPSPPPPTNEAHNKTQNTVEAESAMPKESEDSHNDTPKLNSTFNADVSGPAQPDSCADSKIEFNMAAPPSGNHSRTDDSTNRIPPSNTPANPMIENLANQSGDSLANRTIELENPTNQTLPHASPAPSKNSASDVLSNEKSESPQPSHTANRTADLDRSVGPQERHFDPRETHQQTTLPQESPPGPPSVTKAPESEEREEEFRPANPMLLNTTADWEALTNFSNRIPTQPQVNVNSVADQSILQKFDPLTSVTNQHNNSLLIGIPGQMKMPKQNKFSKTTTTPGDQNRQPIVDLLCTSIQERGDDVHNNHIQISEEEIEQRVQAEVAKRLKAKEREFNTKTVSSEMQQRYISLLESKLRELASTLEHIKAPESGESTAQLNNELQQDATALRDYMRRCEVLRSETSKLRKSEELMRRSLQKGQNDLADAVGQFQAVKSESQSKVTHILTEKELAVRELREHKMRADLSLQKQDLSMKSLKQQYDQKVAECEELTKICDNLILMKGK